MVPKLAENPRILWGLVALVLIATTATGVAVASAAGQTAVGVNPALVEIEPGEQTTLAVVVTDVDGDVGAWEGSLGLSDASAVDIVDVQLAGDPGLANVDIESDGSAASFEVALADTNDTGSVTIMTVTVAGVTDGRTDTVLTIDALGDEQGATYDVTGTSDATIVVGEGAPDNQSSGISESQDETTATETQTTTTQPPTDTPTTTTETTTHADDTEATTTVTATTTAATTDTGGTDSTMSGTRTDSTVDAPNTTPYGATTVERKSTNQSPPGTTDASAPGFGVLELLAGLVLVSLGRVEWWNDP